MPYITSKSRRSILEVKQGHLFDRLISNFFDSTYAGEDSTGQKYVYPGLVVARDTDTNKFVPYSSGASYGTGSNTAVGVLDEFLDVTMGDEAITPVYLGKLIEAHVYVYGVAVGTVSGAVKTALARIEWV